MPRMREGLLAAAAGILCWNGPKVAVADEPPPSLPGSGCLQTVVDGDIVDPKTKQPFSRASLFGRIKDRAVSEFGKLLQNQKISGIVQDVLKGIIAGKPFKVIVIACMRKLLTILNVMLKENRPWDPNRLQNA